MAGVIHSPFIIAALLEEPLMFEPYTLGIEEEFQIIDPQTRELRSHVSEFLEEGQMLLG